MDRFDKIDFGRARAELERSDHPILIQKGFLDPNGIVPILMDESTYLVLGSKGSGKSAVAEKLLLESTYKTNTIASIIHLSDFPYASFSKIMSGKEDPETRFPTTWSWLLLIMLLDSFSKDQASPTQYDAQFVKAINSLIDVGLLPPNDISTVVAKSSKNSFKIALHTILEATFEDARVPLEIDMQFRRLVDHLKELVNQFKSPNKHILIIDGLDDILLRKEIQYQSLAALVYEADRLNLTFMKNDVGAKIILLCRTDLFERLPGPNKNKIRQDSAYEIDWYHDPRKPRDSFLVQLVNLRGSIHFHRDVDIFSLFFPQAINQYDTVAFLLNRTRHTPRDFIQLLNHLKPFYQGRPFDRAQILSGIRQYSMRYFLPEIWDELAGYVPREHFDCFIRVIRSKRKRATPYPELLSSVLTTEIIEQRDFDNMLYALYECSAIGHRWEAPGYSEWRFDFKYRNPNSVLNTQNEIILHTGLWKALNLE